MERITSAVILGEHLQACSPAALRQLCCCWSISRGFTLRAALVVRKDGLRLIAASAMSAIAVRKPGEIHAVSTCVQAPLGAVVRRPASPRGLLALGVYITYKLLDFADLSVDGFFATGGAVAVTADPQ